MHDELARSSRAALFAATVSTFMAVAGCGGGGGGGDTTAASPPPAPSVSGVVIDGPIQGATVCLDLDKNGSCDAGEPASAPTDSQGRYTITGITGAQIADAPLVAVIPADAIDAGTPVGTAYKLGAPAGKGAVISPLTHLVQLGVAQGRSLAAAEAAVAAQLQIAAGSLYSDYTASASGDNAELARMGPALVSAIRSGATLSIEAPAASAADYVVAGLRWSRAGSYDARYFYSSNVPDANGAFAYYDLRRAASSGNPSSFFEYAFAYLGTQGWVTFGGSTPNPISHGNPFRSTWAGTSSIATRTEVDVGGKPMSDAVAMTQDLAVNTYATVFRLDPTTLTGTMPAGAKLVRIREATVSTPVTYSSAGDPVRLPFGPFTPVAHLQDMVGVYPSSAPSGGPSVWLVDLPSDDVACGAATCTRDVRVQFGAGQVVKYLACDTPVGGVTATCQDAGTGRYTLGTGVDGVTPIMTLTDGPMVVSTLAYVDVVFVERNGAVYLGEQEKPYIITRTMLGRVAFEAIAPQLGITPPAVPATVSAFAGRWSGSPCESMSIDAVGWIVGQCDTMGSPPVFGSVSADGTATFATAANAINPASFSGTFSATSGSGTWTQGSLDGGSWSATRLP